ncbi:MAG TPA: hypothetical protein VFA24_00170 [Gaiellaceae bacterium]|nr:hypothetical protein [Gaiellaceae bacterium]
MELEIRPEPTPAEREAILRALDADREPQPSKWWLAGVRESIGEDDHRMELRTAGTDPFGVSP